MPPKGQRKAPLKKPKTPRKITETYLHNAGLFYLQRFATSKNNFKNVMLRKIKRSCAYHKEQDMDSCTALLEKLVSKFEELGLLDDEAYARAMVTSCRRRGLSSKAIRAKLLTKGLASEQIQDALRNHDSSTIEDDTDPDFVAALRTAQRKRLGPFSKPVQDSGDEERQKKFKKELAAMARAGFGFDIARKVLTMDAEEALDYSSRKF